MEAEALAVCAALYTGFAWGAGALSTWLAVKPMRRKLEMLEAWRDRVCEMGRQANEANAQWADRVETWCSRTEAVLTAHANALNSQQEQMQSVLGEVEELRGAVWMLRGSPVNGGGLFAGGQDAWAMTACSRNLSASVKAAKLGAKEGGRA